MGNGGDRQLNNRGPRTRDRAIRLGERVGSFQYLRAEDRWEWSDAVAYMHGYAPGQVRPTTALVMSHKHPDDAANVAALIDAMTGQGRPFSSRHRIVDTRGRIHLVVVIGERMCDDSGKVIDDFTVELQVPSGIRERADHILLTAHQRIATPVPQTGSRSDAC
jgi:hypothetical protein